jgi:hypothetical protein
VTVLLLPIFFLAQALPGQVVPAKQPAEYPVHAQAGATGIGAEFMVHVVSIEGQSYFVPDYFVVEVAVFPEKGALLELRNGQFSLRINGKKQELTAHTPGFAAASLKYPEWSQRPSVTASAGAGDGGIVIGRPQTQPRFPGDNRPPRQAGPAQTTVDSAKEPPMTAADAVTAAALFEGPIDQPTAGYLYFPYRGDGKKAKTIELIYRGPAGAVTLRLR